MKTRLLAMTIACVTSSAFANTNTATQPNEPFAQQAKTYFSTTHAKTQFQNGVVAGLKNTFTAGKPSVAHDALIQQLAQQYFPWQPLEQRYIKIMQDNLNKKDLAQATEFFKTPAGKQLVAIEPLINQQSIQYIQQSLRKNGRNIEQSINQAQFNALLKKAQSKKPVSALTQATLGELYLKGIGTQASAKKALPWFKKAAERQNPMAQAELGKLYATGNGVKTNLTRAAIWYHRAASQGDANAMYQVARAFAKGLGVPKDAEKAAKWYLSSAIRSNICAKYAIGVDYAKGNGVKKDPTLAKAWLSSFAEMAYFTLNPHSQLKNLYDISNAYAAFEVETLTKGKTNAQHDTELSEKQLAAISNLQQHAHKICV